MHSTVSKHVLHQLSFLLKMLTIYFIRTPEDHKCHLSQLCLSLQLKISRKEVGAKEIGTGTLAEYLG